MEDADIAILEALAMWNYSVQEGVIEGKGGDGRQEPTVPWDGKQPRQACSTNLHPMVHTSAMLGRSWGSLGRVPLNLQKRPRNLGKPAPALIARACLGLQKGGAEAEQEGTGIGNYFGKTLKTPQGLPSAPWQMSVRVAPSTMNWGFENSSCKRPRVLSLGQPLLETGTQPSQTPL